MNKIKIGKKIIGEKEPCFIIAEAGVNHNGDVVLAKKMIDTAVEAGVDAIKFQTFKAEDLVVKGAKTEKYQMEQGKDNESQFEMLKKLELSDVNFRDLKKYCDSKKIVFLSTPYDEKSADFLEKLGVSAFKISSSDLTHLPLLKHVAKKRLPIIISTGASNLNEVNLAVKCVKAVGNKNIILLHCTAAYPTMIKDVNLNQMLTLKKNFKSLSAGYSDHTLSVLVPAMAVALGACIIEKHFTLDRNFIGPDHKASMEPEELRQIVKNIRDAESALGSSLKEPCKIEYEDRELGRRSIVAGVDIKKGEKIKENMLAIKRPGTGVEPKNLGKIIGKTAKEDIKKDSLIKYKSIK